LFLGDGVSFDSQRALNGFNAVYSTQPDIFCKGIKKGKLSRPVQNLGNEGEDFGSDSKGGGVVYIHIRGLLGGDCFSFEACLKIKQIAMELLWPSHFYDFNAIILQKEPV